MFLKHHVENVIVFDELQQNAVAQNQYWVQCLLHGLLNWAKRTSTYSNEPINLHENGQLTLSENIADLAGLSAAYDAYKQEMAGKQGPVINGFTDDQTFFIAFAQTWRTKNREESDRQQVMTDGHALDRYRAATVRNLDAWYDAFAVKPGQRLYLAPTARARVW